MLVCIGPHFETLRPLTGSRNPAYTPLQVSSEEATAAGPGLIQRLGRVLKEKAAGCFEVTLFIINTSHTNTSGPASPQAFSSQSSEMPTHKHTPRTSAPGPGLMHAHTKRQGCRIWTLGASAAGDPHAFTPTHTGDFERFFKGTSKTRERLGVRVCMCVCV
jgi:hypothetical protein